MARMCEQAGVRRLTVHGLRHTFVSLAGAGGAERAAVSAHVGHASAGFTLNQYRHVYAEERRGLTLNPGQKKTPPAQAESEAG